MRSAHHIAVCATVTHGSRTTLPVSSTTASDWLCRHPGCNVIEMEPIKATQCKPFLAVICRPAENIIADELKMYAELGHLDPGIELKPIRALEAGATLDSIDLSNYSGVFISGSEFGYLDPPESKSEAQTIMEEQVTAFAQRLVAADFPTLGLCYGMHALAIAGGGTLTSKYSEDIAAPEITLTPAGKNDHITKNIPNPFHAFLGHHDSVGDLPPESEILAASAACPVQMLRIKQNVYSTQFHPEISNEGMKIRTAYYSGSYYDSEAREAIEQMRAAADVRGAHQIIAAFTARYRRHETQRR